MKPLEAIKSLRLYLPKKPSRRFQPSSVGSNIDMRRSLRIAPKSFGAVFPHFKRQNFEDRSIIVLLDISGSMDSYTRMMVHFMHTLTTQHRKVTSFIFGTHLTNITRQLKTRDIDVALKAVANSTDDWSGGTASPKILNISINIGQDVLSGNPIILLISDGLENYMMHVSPLKWSACINLVNF